MSRRVRRGATVQERIDFYVQREGDCWIWTGKRLPAGYGRMSYGGKWNLAHRMSYTHLVGPIPEGLDLDHLCRNRACVNPAHLEPVTRSVNLRRGVGGPAINAAKTHCIRGHEFTPENTAIAERGKRRCRKCACWHARNRRLKALAASP